MWQGALESEYFSRQEITMRTVLTPQLVMLKLHQLGHLEAIHLGKSFGTVARHAFVRRRGAHTQGRKALSEVRARLRQYTNNLVLS